MNMKYACVCRRGVYAGQVVLENATTEVVSRLIVVLLFLSSSMPVRVPSLQEALFGMLIELPKSVLVV